SPKVDLTLAIRGDYDNIYEKFQVSPRAAVVFKPSTTQSFRITYNRAFSAPSVNSLFLDIPARTTSFPGGLKFILQGRGARDGFSFDTFRSSNTARFFLPVPGAFGQDIPIATMPLQALYGAGVAGFGATLRSNDPLPPPFTNLPAAQREALADLLDGFTPFIQGSTTGVLGIPDGSDTGYTVVGGPVDISPLKQTTTQTIEVGFKGLFGDNFLFTIDGYYTKKKDFVGPLLVTSPLVYVPDLAADLAPALTPVIQGAALDPQVAGFLASLGLDAATAAQLISGLLSVGFNAPGNPTPVAAVQPDSNNPALESNDGTAVGGFLSYRNFGNVDFFGVDAAFEYQASKQFTIFGNFSFVSDDFFDNEELDEDDESTVLALNAPKIKFKAGLRYATSWGFSFSASGRYIDAFEIRSGPYVGELESYFQLDAGIGYDLDKYARGMKLDVGVSNLLDDDHREFIGAPKLGRMVIARATYSVR
ncbi:MAG: TonB-dependent receptor, partial [Bacteroidetes bacterium]